MRKLTRYQQLKWTLLSGDPLVRVYWEALKSEHMDKRLALALKFLNAAITAVNLKNNIQSARIVFMAHCYMHTPQKTHPWRAVSKNGPF